ncbi:hypothetical protein ALC57_06017 [Trachymyrmex cornetzi]|uniref:Uncharacterized protein n=1 Tax=Trachymyrmex cornetzi TaxID=471704 RepID=A0A151J9E8_9HYME|nr:hypothetical protein ALC57_06017 [Trachymyrmex cornetzi]
MRELFTGALSTAPYAGEAQRIADSQARRSPAIYLQSLKRRLDGCIMAQGGHIFNNSSNCFISSEELKLVFVFLFLTSF